MEFSDLTVRLILLFLPGVLSKIIVDALTVVKNDRPFFFIVYSLVLGFLTYLTYSAIIWLYNLFPWTTGYTSVNFLGSLMDTKVKVDISEIIYVCILSVPVGFAVSFAITKSYLHRLAKRLKASHKFADQDVWSYLFNSADTDWVTVYDFKNNLIFQGWVQLFSESHNEAELLLRSVTVHDGSTGAELYKSTTMYLNRDKGDITIDFPPVEIPG